LLLMAMAVIGLRNVLYAFATEPWHVMALQALHGFTFPAMWLAGVNFAAEAAPKGLSATAQGMFGVILMGVGSAAGNLFSGVMIDRVGLDGMFLAAGSVVLVTLVFMLLVGRRVLSGAKAGVSKA
jgi:PPP family 3-phenylpropionic acid transporter